MARFLTGLEQALLAQRGHLFPFVPVSLACGIGFYFSLPREPAPWQLASAALAGVALLLAQHRARAVLAPLLCAAGLMALGLSLAGWRAHHVAEPILDWRYYGPVTGRIIAIDRSASDAPRVTLDRVWLRGVAATETPRRVRLSLHGDLAGVQPAPGIVVMTTAHLSPPGGTVEPGGFDFRRHAWFQRLGAVGYSRVPLVAWERPQGGQFVFRLRKGMADRIRAAMPEKTGAFAAAIMTGDRSAISRDVMEDLRDTNLAHLLAISGLHMGLLSGFVFTVLRIGLVLGPRGLHWPVKKLSAGGALLAAAFYLALSGGNVATERAFVMVAVMLIAVMLDRRALSLRAVALAALIVLGLRPEALTGPGFQMSFAATTALVAVFAALRDMRRGMVLPRWASAIGSVVLSSAVAGAATAPVAMAHFNQMSQFGLLANLLSVPLMGLLVMPAAVLAVCLMPLGLEAVGLWIAGQGLSWILGVAHEVAAWEGAVRPIPAPGSAVLPLVALGGLFLAIWQGHARWLGLAPALLALWLWHGQARPEVLVAEGGVLVGTMTPEGRALSRARGASFVAGIWLENDGQGLDQRQAARLWPEGAAARVGQWRIHHVHGKRAARTFETCGPRDLVVASTELRLDGPCLLLDQERLRRSGSVALRLDGVPEPLLTTARSLSGERLWTRLKDQ